jgi:O-acetyl-ADP-ribose deacetylase (regulator of RNase III)
MTIVFKSEGSIFDSGAEAIVNPVNCVGVMGAGLAKAFKNRFPEDMFAQYARACADGTLRLGKLDTYFDYKSRTLVINFPTKDDWRDPSLLEYIESGMQALIQFVDANAIEKVALPALGCGLGGLQWNDVSRIISNYCSEHYATYIVYEPQ